ncbi:MAG: hypothetical protein ACI8PT_004154 [Gammaproteobacteria bacterium]|jgi:hypothetical protein
MGRHIAPALVTPGQYYNVTPAAARMTRHGAASMSSHDMVKPNMMKRGQFTVDN